MQILQSLALPPQDLNIEQTLYFRGGIYLTNVDKPCVCLFSKETARFDTFFNIFNSSIWKESSSNIQDLKICLTGQGRITFKLFQYLNGCETLLFNRELIFLNTDQEIFLDVPDFSQIGGLFFFTISAISAEALIFKADWITSAKIIQEIKLAIVITHFNRKEFILPAIKRINDGFLSLNEFGNCVSLIIIDNSQTLIDDELFEYSVTCIPNKNYGGAGGFMRGLIHAKDNGFTHCLFMDDDAACDLESLRRTVRILRNLQDESVAISGALLRESPSYMLFEKGANFDGICHPLKTGLDLRSIKDIENAETNNLECNYGGWWFFAFSIKAIHEFAFPFFIRGDDIRFSIGNQLKVITMNGIATWGANFEIKTSPLSLYFDLRNHIVQMLLMGYSFNKIKKILRHFVVKLLYSYKYDCAEASILALEHVMQGPNFFIDNIDVSNIRKKILSFSDNKNIFINNKFIYSEDALKNSETNLRMVVRKVSLNGFLLPFFLIKKRTIIQPYGFIGDLKNIYRYAQIEFFHEQTGKSDLRTYNRLFFIKLFTNYLFKIIKFKLNFAKLRLSYLTHLPDITSEMFWRETLAKESDTKISTKQ